MKYILVFTSNLGRNQKPYPILPKTLPFLKNEAVDMIFSERLWHTDFVKAAID